MRILLLSMPDSFEHTPTLAVRMPNGALASLAGNVDPHHRRRDRRSRPGAVVGAPTPSSGWCATSQPDVVGLSVMTFQRATARRIIALIRSLRPTVRIVVGGYDPSLAPEAWTHPDARRRLHRPRRRRPDVPRAAARARRARRRCRRSPGSGSATADAFRRNPPRPIDADRGRRRSGRRTARRACCPATRCSAARSTSSRRRAAARSTAASARSSRCAAATSTASRSRA